MRPGKLLLLVISLLCFSVGNAQNDYLNNTFIFPLEVNPVLSGTFGELRSNHFHSGIDVKTQGAVGLPVYAIEDGYVSRIKVSPSGFGNTLYINHEDGYTSVFAHLQSFRRDLAEYVKSEQYRRESFAVDLYLEKGQYLVAKGEIVALSGNSGYSFGPHLHFEIREASTQQPINPLLFGYKIKDDIPPKIKKLKIYPESADALINGAASELKLQVSGYGMKHDLVDQDTIFAYGDLSFGLLTYDLMNGAGNKNGVFEVKLWYDDSLRYHLRIEKFAFSETRYINSLIDYPAYKQNNERYIRSKLDPNNRLNVYEQIINDGIIVIRDTRFHELRFEVIDVKQNHSALKILIKGTGLSNPHENKIPPKDGQVISWRDESIFESKGIEIFFPAYAFYDHVDFTYSTSLMLDGTFAPVHHIHHDNTPIHKYLTLSIQAVNLPAELQDKALLARVNGENGNVMSAAGGAYTDGWVRGKIRDFGKYTIIIDTVAPRIKPLNVRNGQQIMMDQKIKFKVKDDLSGLKSYRGTINGEWILIQYDAKNNLLFYLVDERTMKGDNHFKLEVSDQKDNITIFEAELKLN